MCEDVVEIPCRQPELSRGGFSEELITGLIFLSLTSEAAQFNWSKWVRKSHLFFFFFLIGQEQPTFWWCLEIQRHSGTSGMRRCDFSKANFSSGDCCELKPPLASKRYYCIIWHSMDAQRSSLTAAKTQSISARSLFERNDHSVRFRQV